jgi:hypothetical protein
VARPGSTRHRCTGSSTRPSRTLSSAYSTLLLVGIGFVAVWAGGAALVRSQTPPSIAFGTIAIAFGFYLDASVLGVVPPVRDWF